MSDTLDKLVKDAVVLRKGKHPIILTDSLTKWLEYAVLEAGVIPVVRTRAGRVIGAKVAQYNITTRDSILMGYEGPLEALVEAMHDACAAMFDEGLIKSDDGQYMGALATELCIRSGVTSTIPAQFSTIGDMLREPSAKCSGKVGMFVGAPARGSGPLVALDLVGAYAHAAAESAPCDSFRNATTEWVENYILRPMAQGKFIKNHWVQERPIERSLSICLATPPKDGSSWVRPLPQKPDTSRRWLWPNEPFEGPLWDATIDEMRRNGWQVELLKSWVWPVGWGWFKILQLLKKASKGLSKLALKICKLAVLRAVGMLAYEGPKEYAVFAETPEKREKLPEGAMCAHYGMGIWSVPMEDEGLRPPTYRPYIAQAIWAWSRRELTIHAQHCMGPHRPIAMYVDSVWASDFVCETNRLKVKETWEGDWNIPYAGALELDGKWIYRPGVGRSTR